MTHLSELEISMAADAELADEAMRVHLAGCDGCRQRVDELAAERRAITAAFAAMPDGVPDRAAIPAFVAPRNLGRFALLNLATGIVVWCVQFLWKSLFEGLVFEALSIFAFPVPDVMSVVIDFIVLWTIRGAAMLDQYSGFIALSVVSVALAGAAAWYARGRLFFSLAAMLPAVVLVLSTLVAAPAVALDVRHQDDVIRIDADETIDDTLIAAGDSIVIEGHVTGDVLAFGDRVVVSGTIDGNLVTAGDQVRIEGSVGGSILSAADSIEVDAPTVGGNFWGAANRIEIGKGVSVRGNVTTASETAAFAGHAGREFTAAAERIELSGSVDGDVAAFAEHLMLLSGSRVGGDVRFHSDDEGNLERSGSAEVRGNVEFIAAGDSFETGNRYTSGGFYATQALWLAAAFLAGLVLLLLFPGLQDIAIGDVGDTLRAAGIGIVSIITLPIASVIALVTLIGLPFGLAGLALWGFLLFFAKIVLASVVGQAVLAGSGREDSVPLTLALGLGVILVVTNVPGIGGILGVLLTITGAGLLVMHVIDYFRGEPV